MEQLAEIQQLDNYHRVDAIVKGEKVSEVPESLYIPPQALRVILEGFEGPLDLLW